MATPEITMSTRASYLSETFQENIKENVKEIIVSETW